MSVRDTAGEKPGTAKQEHAHWMLKLARSDDPTTSDGIAYGGQTFYDREIKVVPKTTCPNGPDSEGNWPCERGPEDECLTCGWRPGMVGAATVALYYVPRSQVWEGSRGRQSGCVHLHVEGRALCGRRRGWYEREPMEGEPRCQRCEKAAARRGIEWR